MWELLQYVPLSTGDACCRITLDGGVAQGMRSSGLALPLAEKDSSLSLRKEVIALAEATIDKKDEACSKCKMLMELYRRTPQAPRDYWLMTELFVMLHNSDVCSKSIEEKVALIDPFPFAPGL